MATTIVNLLTKNQIGRLKISKYLETSTETQPHHIQSTTKPKWSKPGHPAPSLAIIWLLIRVTQCTFSKCHATHSAALPSPLRAAEPPCLQLGLSQPAPTCWGLWLAPSTLGPVPATFSSSLLLFGGDEQLVQYNKLAWRCTGVCLLLK